MKVIRDRDGNIIQRSESLAGIRRYVGGIHAFHRAMIKVLDISEIGARNSKTSPEGIVGGGQLSILFENGYSFQTNFSSYEVLKDFVRRWRNVHGSSLTVNGFASGIVSPKNPNLI